MREQRHWGTFPAILENTLNEPVVCLDIPGVGQRNHMRSPNRIAYLVDDLRTQLRTRGISSGLKLLGLSMGGMITTDWAMSFPCDVDRLVLINSSFRNFSRASERLNPRYLMAFMKYAALPIRQRESVLLDIVSNDPDKREEAKLLWQQIAVDRPVSRRNALMQLESAYRYLAPKQAPKTPVLLISSKGDRLVHPVCSQHISKIWQVPNCVHEYAGHDLIIDDPQWLLTQISDWQQSRIR